jgi:signal transduction histidine kinase
MPPADPKYLDAPVLLLAPIGSDATNAAAVLGKARIRTEICANMRDLCARAGADCGAFMVSEEVLDLPSLNCLVDFLGQQPVWSDIPLVLLTTAGEIRQKTYNILSFLDGRANVTLVEKPLRVITLVSVIQSALRSRRHQYEVRELLESYAASQDSLRQANALLADKASHLDGLVRQRTAKLREIVGDLEVFSYSIAHDMRAPLRSLHGYSDILLADYGDKLNGEGQHLLRRIAKSAERMDKLILDVLKYSRVVRAESPLSQWMRGNSCAI